MSMHQTPTIRGTEVSRNASVFESTCDTLSDIREEFAVLAALSDVFNQALGSSQNDVSMSMRMALSSWSDSLQRMESRLGACVAAVHVVAARETEHPSVAPLPDTVEVVRLSPASVIAELAGLVVLANAVRIAAPSQTPSERCSAWSLLMSRLSEVLARSQELASGAFSERAGEYIAELEDALRLIAPPLPAEHADDSGATIRRAA
jgi:hypothetical protein